MKGTKTASRYAKALLDLANENNSVDQVSNDLRHLFETQEENKDLQNLLSSPIINAQKKRDILMEVFPQFEDLTNSFVQLLIKSGRENLLPQIAQAYDQLLKEQKGIVPVELIMAVDLDSKTKETILNKVRGSVNGELEVSEKIDPSIIGGFIVNMGDKRIDASIQNQLNKLKQSITH